jgi:hypothetical protein
MRITAVALISIGIGAATIVVADPQDASTPAPPQAPAPAATAPTSTAAAAAPKSTVVVQGEQDVLERHFQSEGYKEEMRNGEKVFCRREDEMGSRLGSRKVCSTAQQLQATEREAQSAYQRGQTHQNNPSGK